VQKVTIPNHLQSLMDPPQNMDRIGWLGADAATSVEVAPDLYVWLFGDTILGKSEDGIRKYSDFIHNTIGRAKREEDGGFREIEKYFREKNGGRGAIFSSKKKWFYWPLVGVKLDSQLLIAANRVTTKDSSSFKILGSALFLVHNPTKPPTKWTYEGHYLPKDKKIIWGTALVKKEEWVYLFGKRGTGFSAKTVLSRIRVEEAAKGNWQKFLYWADGKWLAQSKPDTVEGLPGTSETTIQHNSFFGWYCLQIPPLSYEVHLYTAERITGPYQDRGAIYTIPAPWSEARMEKGKRLFIAYAAKSHPELTQKKDQIVLTYNVNLNPFVKGLSGKLQKYLTKKKYEGLYLPQFVSISFDKREVKG